MQTLTVSQAKSIYRTAIDSHALDTEGEIWWEEVRLEMQSVVSARTLAGAAAVIEWWHHDWSVIEDSPRAAAKRIRMSARDLPESGTVPLND